MKSAKKLLGGLAAALTLAALGGCQNVSSSPAAPSSVPLPAGVPEDIILETAGIARDTPLIAVDGVEVSAEEVLYWVAAYADQYASVGMTDFSMDMGEGQTLGGYYLDSAVETAKLYQVVSTHARELGMGWSRENQEAYDAQLSSMKAGLAGQMGLDPETDGAAVDAEYVRLLSYMGLSQEGFFKINQAGMLFDNMARGLFGREGTEAPDAAALDEAGVLRAKHILIKADPVTDEAGNVVDDGMAAALEEADALHAQLMAAEDPVALFDRLMAEKSEDPGSQSQPDGYTFGPGEMVQEFFDGTKALEVGAISRPVQSSYGYHIILRLEPDGDAAYEKYADLKMNERVDEWLASARVEQAPALEELDIQSFYDNLTALRETIAQGRETPAGTAAPTQTPAASPAPGGTASPAPGAAGAA